MQISHSTSKNYFFFFFNDTATTEIYTLSLHDALPIWKYARARIHSAGQSGNFDQSLEVRGVRTANCARRPVRRSGHAGFVCADRKSTRLNSSHLVISYAVFCLKKKN